MRKWDLKKKDVQKQTDTPQNTMQNKMIKLLSESKLESVNLTQDFI